MKSTPGKRSRLGDHGSPASRPTTIEDLSDDCLIHIFKFLDPCFRRFDFDCVPPAVPHPVRTSPSRPAQCRVALSPETSASSGASDGASTEAGGTRGSYRGGGRGTGGRPRGTSSPSQIASSAPSRAPDRSPATATPASSQAARSSAPVDAPRPVTRGFLAAQGGSWRGEGEAERQPAREEAGGTTQGGRHSRRGDGSPRRPTATLSAPGVSTAGTGAAARGNSQDRPQDQGSGRGARRTGGGSVVDRDRAGGSGRCRQGLRPRGANGSAVHGPEDEERLGRRAAGVGAGAPQVGGSAAARPRTTGAGSEGIGLHGSIAQDGPRPISRRADLRGGQEVARTATEREREREQIRERVADRFKVCSQCGAWFCSQADSFAYDSSKHFRHSLVSKRWSRLAALALRRVNLQQLTVLPALRLACELGRLPHVTHLSIPRSSTLPSLTLRFWSALPGALRGLRVLHLGSLPGGERGQTQALDSIFTHCRQLQDLECRSVDHVRSIPESLGLATRLVRLSLRKRPASNTSIIITLPPSVGELRSLEELDLRGCVLLSLPSSLAALPALRVLRLQVEAMQAMRGLHASRTEPCLTVLANLQAGPSLRALQLSSFTARAVPENVLEMESLLSLSLHCCPVLSTVPLSASGLASLRHLRLINCEALVTLPDSLGGLQQLLSLDVAFCSRFTHLPDSLGSLVRLRTMTLVQCPKLKALPETLGALQALEELRMFECSALQELPLGVGALVALRKLFVYKCPLQALPRTFLQLVRRRTTVYIVGKGTQDLVLSFRHCNFRFAVDGSFAVINVTEPEEDGRWLSSYFTALEQFL